MTTITGGDVRAIALKLTDAGLDLDHAYEWVSEVVDARVTDERERLITAIRAESVPSLIDGSTARWVNMAHVERIFTEECAR